MPSAQVTHKSRVSHHWKRHFHSKEEDSMGEALPTRINKWGRRVHDNEERCPTTIIVEEHQCRKVGLRSRGCSVFRCSTQALLFPTLAHHSWATAVGGASFPFDVITFLALCSCQFLASVFPSASRLICRGDGNEWIWLLSSISVFG